MKVDNPDGLLANPGGTTGLLVLEQGKEAFLLAKEYNQPGKQRIRRQAVGE